MQLGLIGLGRMGGNMRERLRAAGHEVVGFDRNPEISDAEDAGRPGRRSSQAPRAVWVMVPAGVTEATIDDLATHLSPGDIDHRRRQLPLQPTTPRGRAARPAGHRLRRRRRLGRHLGQPERLRADGRRLRRARRPAHADLRGAQARGRVRLRARRPGRRRPLRQDGPQRHRVRPDARLRRGLRAAGRLGAGDQRARRRSSRGARAPSSSPGCSTCSTGRSTRTRPWTAIKGYADDTGEGRWTVEEAIRLAVPMHVIAASLFARFESREDDSPAMKAVAALRNQFGGHPVHKS